MPLAEEREQATQERREAEKLQQEVRTVFDEEVGEEWKKYAYCPAYWIARRLGEIALWGMADGGTQADRAYDILSDWEDMKSERETEEFLEGLRDVEGMVGEEVPVANAVQI